ncbi:MAG: hypothetical protein EU532_07020 [Promethearchaeota archaeon]|nr:MAG: hypothetical protein EU532_07020 [Candidatus Lokiarchaeota archaeon]
MTIIEGKTAYPYITEFKKEPFRSFLLLERRDIGKFYLSNYNAVINFYQYFNEKLLKISDLNLENIYWFLLLRKYLGEDNEDNRDHLYTFIEKCAVHFDEKLGFKFSPHSQKDPDVWSTYFALANLKLLGLLKEFLWAEGTDQNIKNIINFLLSHKKGDSFLHCLNEHCEIDKKTTSGRTLYFVLESFTLLGMNILTSRDKFIPYIGSIKKDSALVFKLLCLKYLDLEYEVDEKAVHYLLQFQKENGGFSFKKINGRINTTFWMVYTLDSYYWLLDYNPVGIYSFISLSLNEILKDPTNRTHMRLMELSKLIILVSIIWKKFIDEIERVIFKQLEQENYVNLNLIKDSMGLTNGIEEVISYINLNYTFNLKILDNTIEFNNFLRNLREGEKIIVSEIYDQLKKKNIISLTEIHKRYKKSYKQEPLKLKEDIFPLIHQMTQRNFFKGKIVKKMFSKFQFYLDFFVDKAIVSDTEIKLTHIINEKELIRDIQNDIYNMTLKLKNTSSQIKEEIESYLIIDEINLAKERLKFILRNALMDADFLNENIENSFNLDLYYINIQNVLKSEISQWYKLYSVLSRRLNEIDSYLKDKIAEKEELRNLNRILDQMDEKIFSFGESINRRIDEFRNFLRIFSENEYTDTALYDLMDNFDKIRGRVNEFDKKIYQISQNISLKDEFITKKRNEVINNWISIKEELEGVFNYYLSGLNFFKNNLDKLSSMENEIKTKLQGVKEKTQEKIKENKFQEAFDLIKKESDGLLKEASKEVNEIQNHTKEEMKNRQKLYLLYRTLNLVSENLEERIIESIEEHVQFLKNKIIEQRNKAKIGDFDDFVSTEISKFKKELSDFLKSLDQTRNKKVKDLIKGFERLKTRFEEAQKIYLKKLDNCKEVMKDFDESNVTIIHWNNFYEYFTQEIDILQDESINNLITERIQSLIQEKKSNNVNIVDLKNELDLKCKVLITRIKELIEISKINGKIYEDEKCVVIYTEDYYKNKELRSFIDNKLLKLNQEAIGKLLALYDSSIRNRTLGINMLELQNRVNDLDNFDHAIYLEYNKKVHELQIQIENRKEFLKTRDHLESVIKNNKIAIETISHNLKLFNYMQNFIDQEYNVLKIDLTRAYQKILDEIKKTQEKSYLKIKESFENKSEKLESKLRNAQEKIEIELKTKFDQIKDSDKLLTEIREYSVKKKNSYLREFQEKKEKVYDELIILKDIVFREQLINHINTYKIQISRMLGTLQARVEEDIEIREFKRANYKIQKRARNIHSELASIKKDVKKLVKEFNKQSFNFETKNKYILDDFNKFLGGFNEILSEKVKSLEELILKEYCQILIKAVSNEYLTISFLNNELKMKKTNIQDHLITLISSGELAGKYDPRLGIYYENANVIENLNEDELEVIKSMNFKFYLVYRRLKSFSSLYGSILGLFASILAITYWIYIFSGNNPAVASIPISILILIIIYFMFKRTKEESIA